MNGITNHAQARLNERTSLDIQATEALVKGAISNGYSLNDFGGDLYNYLASKTLKVCTRKSFVKVFQGYVFIFDEKNNGLITMYPLPSKYENYSEYLGGKRPKVLVALEKDTEVEFIDSYNDLTANIEEACAFQNAAKANNYLRNNRNISEYIKLNNLEVYFIPLD